jgi:hypothetical protein
MTSFAIAEGWTMTLGSGRKGHRGSGGWQEVAVAWALAGVLLGVLLLAVPNRGNGHLPPGLWSLAPAAGTHVHPQAPDDEGPASGVACSDRDYASERC